MTDLPHGGGASWSAPAPVLARHAGIEHRLSAPEATEAA